MDKTRAVCRKKSDGGSLKTDVETSKTEGVEGRGDWGGDVPLSAD